ncbi:MAG: sigma-70 family RNA polymerase sigma factor [Oscillospiraceae bacterium]|jgi:RNA polymerase sigma-70 factor (ECF subfamily)|nr:sigma-70 family RNA polymerase sigma factor [Oscillospiraceae bacterium]
MIQEDARLIRQVLDGNADAYEHLVRANEKNVYNLALKMTGNEQDAMDLAQDAFLKAYTNLGKFNGTCKFSVWLYRLTYNLCVDFLRRKKRENTVPLVYEDEDGTDRSLSIPDPGDTPETAAEKAETRREILEAVDKLPEQYREVLLMRCAENMSYAAIARTLGVQEGTVKSRLSRARGMLGEFLTRQGTIKVFHRQKSRKGGEVEW